MGSDRARVTYDPRQYYRSVVMQQGRVTLEADWNEEQLIAGEELRKETLDIVGPSGTPDDGYRVEPVSGRGFAPYDFLVTAGTMYVGGVRVEIPTPVQYSNQSDWLDYTGDPEWVDLSTFPRRPPVNEFVYLMLREQEVSAVEDPDLKDVALGGPDTAQRTRILQHIARVTSRGADCLSGLTAARARWRTLGLQFEDSSMRLLSAGRLKVTFSELTSSGPCEPQAVGGYVAPDNQLIRVQISSTRTPRFLWGFDDASFLYRVEVDPNNPQTLIFSSSPVDNFRQPVAGQAVEILRSAAELANGGFVASASGFVVTLDQNYQPGTQSITLPSGVTLPPEYLTAAGSPAAPLFLRVWQEERPFQRGTPTPLGDTGLLIALDTILDEPFHLGDFWMFAVRPATPRQVYPERYQIDPQPPEGPREWACPLGVIAWSRARGVLVADCRNHFDNLVELTRRWEGCCTVTVRPRDVTRTRTMQSIIDAAANGPLAVRASTPGSAGNNITVSIHNMDATASPPTFSVTVTETDFYPGLTATTMGGILGTGDQVGTKPGLAHLLIPLQGLPQAQTTAFGGGAEGRAAQADFVGSNGRVAFTLQAKSAGVDGNLTTASLAMAPVSGTLAFDLTLRWSKTITGITLETYQQSILDGLIYEIRASTSRTVRLSLPVEGSTTLSGGADGNSLPGGPIVEPVEASGFIPGSPAKVCLRPGTYFLSAPVRIGPQHGTLTIESCPGGATLRLDLEGGRSPSTEMIQIVEGLDVRLHGLTLEMADAGYFDQGLLLGSIQRAELERIKETTLTRMRIALAIRIVGSRSVTVEDCEFRYPQLPPPDVFDRAQFFAAVLVNGDCGSLQILSNRFAGPANIASVTQTSRSAVLIYGYIQASSAAFGTISSDFNSFSGTVFPSTADSLRIEGNYFTNLAFPVFLQAPAALFRFLSNRVESCFTGLTIGTPSYYNYYNRASVGFPNATISQQARAFFANPMVQNSVSVPVAIPLPQDYLPPRSIEVVKTANTSSVPFPGIPSDNAPGEPVSAAPPFAAAIGDPLLTLDDIQPFTLRMVQFAALTPGLSVTPAGPTQKTPDITLHIIGNHIEILPGPASYAILVGTGNRGVEFSLAGALVMTGNTLFSGLSSVGSPTASPVLATVFLDGLAQSAIAGNVVINRPGPNSQSSAAILVVPPNTLCAATGNVFSPQAFLPPRPTATPPLDPWNTYNDVR